MNFVLLGILFGILFLGFTPVFAETNYNVLSHPKFSNQPVVCIYEPDEPNATEIIKERWVKETEIGIKYWQYELDSTETRQTDKWDIHTQIVSLEDSLFFDNKDCDVEVKFDAVGAKMSSGSIYAGIHWYDDQKSQIRLVYTDLEVCKTWTDDKYRYREWCYKDDYTRSKAIGNIATHEFGHAIGLGHYTSSDPQENNKWSSDPYGSPSVMTEAVHYDETLNMIRKIDVDLVKKIYGNDGFGKQKEVTPQNIPVFEEKNFGGFESFFVSNTEFIKKRGTVDFVTISGKVTEDAYSKGQNVLINVVFPDGHDEEMKALTVSNRQFSIQIRVDDTIQIGKYTLDARYMGYDSQTLSFTVSDFQSNTVEEPVSIPIPHWIRNNAKWWSEGTIADHDFVMGVQYLAQQNIIQIEHDGAIDAHAAQEIPSWIKTNAGWWSQGLITDMDFVKGLQFLAQQGIIKVR